MNHMPDAAIRAHRLGLLSALRLTMQRHTQELSRLTEATTQLLAIDRDLAREIRELEQDLVEQPS